MKILRLVKRCPSCGKEKNRDEFYRSVRRFDGLCSICIACRQEYISQPKIREMARLRNRGSRKSREKEILNELSPKGIIRKKLQNAVQRGKVKKPKTCSFCGVGGIIHGHHYDYSKPFEVIWVCPLCHNKIHRKIIKKVAIKAKLHSEGL